jgi:manganese/zinc/iron transport system permease protein
MISNTGLVFIGSGFLGLLCGVVGVILMLKKQSLIGDAVAHATLPGVCLAFLVVGERNFPALLLGGLTFSLIAHGLITLIRNETRLKDDASLAVVIGGFFGLGIMLSSMVKQGGIETFLFGKAASLLSTDVVALVIMTLITLSIIVLGFKEIFYVVFDKSYSYVLGIPVKLVDFTLAFLITVVTVLALPAVGVVLVVAFLVIPAACAKLLTNSLNKMLIISGLLGLAFAIAGTYLSLVSDLPAGAIMTLVGFIFFSLVALVAR